MTKAEFGKIFKKVKGAYPNRFIVGSEKDMANILETHYEFLGKYDPDVFEIVVDNWILKNNNPPTIKDLRHDCRQKQYEKDGKWH